MHGKEAVISPAFRKRLGLRVETPKGLDTDALGTFTGEIARIGTIRETSIAKARLGMTTMGISIGIASEGSYGPHPHIPFIAGGIELMVVVDDDRGIVVCEHLIDDAPVYDHVITAEIGDIISFLDRICFPDHDRQRQRQRHQCLDLQEPEQAKPESVAPFLAQLPIARVVTAAGGPNRDVNTESQ